MSRVGKNPITVPPGVKVIPGVRAVQVEGPNGKLTTPLPFGISCAMDGSTVVLKRASDSKRHKAMHGLARTLLANAVEGTARGFTRDLQIEGIGYRAQIQGTDLNMTLGYSHPVVYPVPEGIQVKVENQTKIAVTGADRQLVGQVAAEIRGLRPPEPYKGKGIRYADEQVKRKVGKTGA